MYSNHNHFDKKIKKCMVSYPCTYLFVQAGTKQNTKKEFNDLKK